MLPFVAVTGLLNAELLSAAPLQNLSSTPQSAAQPSSSQQIAAPLRQDASPAATPGADTSAVVGTSSSKTVSATNAKASAPPAGPTDPKAIRIFAEAKEFVRKRDYLFALNSFRAADKQDGGHCRPCELDAYNVAKRLRDFKAEREQAALLLEDGSNITEKAEARYLAGAACLNEGVQNSREKSFQAADQEFRAALELEPANTNCIYADGLALSHMKQDGSARERFQAYLKYAQPNDVNFSRAQRFVEHPELARARVAPNFRLTALDGKTVELEELTGKVVLIDFWATWCGPCREALPRVRQIAKKFEGQPLVVLSISLDKDDAKWRDFVAHNAMTWIQYRDVSTEAPLARLFGVSGIPATFTIDADGILQDQHVGDADIEGKIKKLVARASEMRYRKTTTEGQ